MGLQLRKSDARTREVGNNDPLTDYELVVRIRAGELALLELLMRRYNQRLFRIARGILRDDGEAEEVVQDTYIRAYQHLEQFKGPQGFSTWLCRIAVNQALARARRADWQSRHLALEQMDDPESLMSQHLPPPQTPEDCAYRHQLRDLMQNAIDTLPDPYRVAFMMREVEQMSVDETATCLGVEPGTVKTRVFRARRLLRRALTEQVQTTTHEAFGFAGHRCDRIVAQVFARLTARGVRREKNVRREA